MIELTDQERHKFPDVMFLDNLLVLKIFDNVQIFDSNGEKTIDSRPMNLEMPFTAAFLFDAENFTIRQIRVKHIQELPAGSVKTIFPV
jgi:hypothetical protein